VIERLVGEVEVPISVDTTKPTVAAAALDAGAVIVNDVSAGRLHPAILEVVADRRAGYVAMHMQGQPRTMQQDPRYDDVVVEVGDYLVERLETAQAAGIDEASLAADPGIGFGKTAAHNLRLLAELPALCDRSGSRCWSGRPASASWGRSSPTWRAPTGNPARPARRRHPGHRGLGAGPRRPHRAGP